MQITSELLFVLLNIHYVRMCNNLNLPPQLSDVDGKKCIYNRGSVCVFCAGFTDSPIPSNNS